MLDPKTYSFRVETDEEARKWGILKWSSRNNHETTIRIPYNASAFYIMDLLNYEGYTRV